MPTTLITDAIRKAAQDLLAKTAAVPYGQLISTSETRKQLKAIADPTSRRKYVDVDWWRRIHGNQYVHAPNLKDAPVNLAKVEKLKALADPERNSNAHEREAAAKALARFRPRQPPTAPGLEEYERAVERAEAALEAEREAARRASPFYGMTPEEMQAELLRRRETWRAERSAIARKAAETRKARRATQPVPDSVSTPEPAPSAPEPQPVPDSVTTEREEEPMKPQKTPERVVRAHAVRAAARAAARAGRKCEVCGKALHAARSTARYCSVACRVKAFRGR
jgi:hypothetical protein